MNAWIHLLHCQEKRELPLDSQLFDLAPKLRFGCRAGACGICAIKVESQPENLSAMTEFEKRALKTMNLTADGLRLACQVTVTGPCAVSSYKRPLRKTL